MRSCNVPAATTCSTMYTNIPTDKNVIFMYTYLYIRQFELTNLNDFAQHNNMMKQRNGLTLQFIYDK